MDCSFECVFCVGGDDCSVKTTYLYWKTYRNFFLVR